MNVSGRIFVIALLMYWSFACAGGSGGITKDHGTAKMAKPSVILVYPFGFRAEVVVIDTALLKGGRKVTKAEREDLGRAVSAAVARKVVEKLEATGIHARQASSSTEMQRDALLVKGNFTKIDQGDQAARVAVGMGAGVEKIEVRLQVDQVTRDGVRPLTEEFHQAQGDKMPGMAVSMGVGGSVAMAAGEKALSESLGGFDAAVDDLADSTVKFYQRRGWGP